MGKKKPDPVMRAYGLRLVVIAIVLVAFATGIAQPIISRAADVAGNLLADEMIEGMKSKR